MKAKRATATVLERRPNPRSAASSCESGEVSSGELDLRRSEGLSDSPDSNGAAVPAGGKRQLPDRLAALVGLGLGDLRLEWRRLNRAEPPRLSRDIMMRAIAYRMQEVVHGGLSKVTQRRLATLAGDFDADGRIAPPPAPRIKPGSRLIREWHGRTHAVCVAEDGFEFEGKTYRSLTQIAREITGAQWSGPRFFGLTKTASVAMPSEVSNRGEIISETPHG